MSLIIWSEDFKSNFNLINTKLIEYNNLIAAFKEFKYKTYLKLIANA
jgi:hypothetical protein